MPLLSAALLVLTGCDAPCADGYAPNAAGMCDPVEAGGSDADSGSVDTVGDTGGDSGGDSGTDDTGGDTDTGGHADRPPNLVLVFLDTLRADHAEYLPTLQMLREESTAGAMQTETWTVASLYEYLTGRDNTVIGSSSWRSGQAQLDPDVETLADRLREHDYYSAAVSQNAQFGSASATTTSFDAGRLAGQGDSDALKAQVDAALENRDPSQPVLLMVSLASAHDPYAEPRAIDAAAAADLVEASDCPVDFRVIGALDELQSSLAAGDIAPGDGLFEDCATLARALYGFDAASADEQLAQLLTHLEDSGILGDDDVLVVTNDHGEALAEVDSAGAARLAHGYSPTAPVTDGFVYVRGPNFAPGATFPGRKTPADIGATLAALGGYAASPPADDPTWGALLTADTSARPAMSFYCGIDQARADRPYTLTLRLRLDDGVVVMRRAPTDEVSVSAYDVAVDPAEGTDLALRTAPSEMAAPFPALYTLGVETLDRLAREAYCGS